ncbi:MAG: UDP-N-acetylmuramoyl-L-alanine--D-glutamate ligase, partial [Muribaculaceae bacterium]|nr:UDP-N-acetylmuramoyl-L-alanine--D-glutamate ligase [Muribaculaceae bacterium]
MEKLVVLGGGESGVGAAILGKEKGMRVFLSDMGSLSDHYRDILLEEGIDFEEGKHSEEKILDADIVVKSPGIPPYAPMVEKIAAKGIP